MIVSYKLWLSTVLLGCMIGGCSSSGGASPAIAGGGTTATGSTTSTGSTADSSSDAGTTMTGTSDMETSGSTSAGSTNGGTDVVGAGPIELLQGRWATNCLVDEDTGGVLYLRYSLSVDGANVNREKAAFSDPDCTVPQSLVFNGSSIQSSGVTLPTGETVTTTLGSAEAVNFFFDEATIDNAPLPSQAIGVDGFSEEIIYDIVLVNSGRLYLGDTKLQGYSGKTPQSRPISLELGVSYGRVQ